jgi:hypothetical protein
MIRPWFGVRADSDFSVLVRCTHRHRLPGTAGVRSY